MLKGIKQIQRTYKKSGRSWVLVETTKKTINETYYNNFVNAKSFFKALGGYERHDRSYTSWGYNVTEVTAIDPGRTTKKVTEFDFMKAFPSHRAKSWKQYSERDRQAAKECHERINKLKQELDQDICTIV